MANVLALNAYHGGSHQAFLDGWARRSRHRFTMLTLPAYKWKWRMRHAAVTFAEQTARLVAEGRRWDVLFCTDMLNLAEFRGLCPLAVRRLPTVVYFHENQLTYPTQHAGERDLHFAFTNMTTALAADRVWFNSAFHRDEFLAALDDLLPRMPDHQPREVVSAIRTESEIRPPGIEPFPARSPRKPGPIRILWASRWEHDKAPQAFFDALDVLATRGRKFRVSVLGESFGQVPKCFEQARRRFADYVDHWGYLPEPENYRAVLAAADVVVSTAKHEFFGIAVLEAIAAGCFPIVPKRLAYPELLGESPEFFYDGTVADLVDRLMQLSEDVEGVNWPRPDFDPYVLVAPYVWESAASQMDEAIEELRGQSPDVA
jgi:glycosyltransferase involved in cell wall biosynthesis